MTAPSPSPAQPSAGNKLTPAEKRALREQARREFKAQEAARFAAAKAGTDGGTPAAAAGGPAAAPGTPPDPSTRTDADRARDAAVALRGVLMPVAGLFAGFFGYDLVLEEFTEKQAGEDARAWVPILARYRWLDVAVTWMSAPARLVARVRELARKRPPASSATVEVKK